MGLSKYRSDVSETQNDGAIVWRSTWLGGKTLAKIVNCRTHMSGEPRVTAHITGEADTWFSIPAKAYYMGKVITGYVTGDDAGLMFRHCYYS